MLGGSRYESSDVRAAGPYFSAEGIAAVFGEGKTLA